ncbi:MAG: NAD(P)-dependent oxidoreductase [Pseudomonadota bacterium]
MIVAITGATGFVGTRLVERALAAGHNVRALTRRPQPARAGMTWVAGALEDAPALADLTAGADAVVHVAAAVNAPDRAGFAAANVAGTAAVVAASAGRRFVHVSSLAAREPALSDYGWSKAEAERVVMASGLDWTIVRPPAVYGPGDLELRDVFRLANLGLALLPPPGRISIVHVDDIARLLLACAVHKAGPVILEPEDASGGMTHAAFAQAVGAAVGRRVMPLPLPRGLLSAAAWLDGRVRGAGAKLTPDRVGYLCHPDWTADPAKAPPAALWQPEIATAAGMRETAAWYRANGLL